MRRNVLKHRVAVTIDNPSIAASSYTSNLQWFQVVIRYKIVMFTFVIVVIVLASKHAGLFREYSTPLVLSAILVWHFVHTINFSFQLTRDSVVVSAATSTASGSHVTSENHLSNTADDEVNEPHRCVAFHFPTNSGAVSISMLVYLMFILRRHFVWFSLDAVQSVFIT